MYERTTVIVNSTGLHARPAATFIKCSKGFSSEITIRNLSVDPPQEGNAKSMLGVLKLAMRFPFARRVMTNRWRSIP